MLSMRETADYLGIAYRTLANNWKRWGLQAHRVGRAVRFRERDIERWLEAPERAA